MNTIRRITFATLMGCVSMLIACGGDDSDSTATEASSNETVTTDDTTTGSVDPLDVFVIWDYLEVAITELPYGASAYPVYVEDSSPLTLRVNVTTDEPQDLTPVCELVANYIDENAPDAELKIEVFDEVDLITKANREVGGTCTAAS